MNGLEYIHVYDDCLDLAPHKAQLDEYHAERLGTRQRLHPDDENFGSSALDPHGIFLDAIGRYSAEHPSLTVNWTLPIMDSGYFYDAIPLTENLIPASEFDSTHALACAVLFLSDTKYVDFPVQGITIKGQAGRVVVFPAQWTHRHSLFGQGGVVTTTFLLGDPK